MNITMWAGYLIDASGKPIGTKPEPTFADDLRAGLKASDSWPAFWRNGHAPIHREPKPTCAPPPKQRAPRNIIITDGSCRIVVYGKE